MLKQMHKFFLFVVITCFLLSSSAVFALDDTIPVAQDITQNGEGVELIHNDVHVEDSDIEPISTGNIKDSVVPDPSKEGKKVVGLFFKTMAGVLFCTILIYLMLLIYKKFQAGSFSNAEYDELDTLDLSTPNNRNDALKSFLNRTK